MLPTEAGDVAVHVKRAGNKRVNSQQLEGLHVTLQPLRLLTVWEWNQPYIFIAIAKQPMAKQDDQDDEPIANELFVETSVSDL